MSTYIGQCIKCDKSYLYDAATNEAVRELHFEEVGFDPNAPENVIQEVDALLSDFARTANDVSGALREYKESKKLDVLFPPLIDMKTFLDLSDKWIPKMIDLHGKVQEEGMQRAKASYKGVQERTGDIAGRLEKRADLLEKITNDLKDDSDSESESESDSESESSGSGSSEYSYEYYTDSDDESDSSDDSSKSVKKSKSAMTAFSAQSLRAVGGRRRRARRFRRAMYEFAGKDADEVTDAQLIEVIEKFIMKMRQVARALRSIPPV